MNTEPRTGESQKSVRVAHCWKLKGCNQMLCPMYLNDSTNACYYISGTLAGKTPETITSKIDSCKKCECYQFNERRSHELRERVLERLKQLEEDLHSLFKVPPAEKTALFKQRAEYLSKRINERTPEEKVRILTFALGNETYCIRIRHALEIITVSTINVLPCTPVHFAGIINLRGTILTLIDLCQFLGVERGSPSPSVMAIVIEVDGETAGLVVNKVEHIVDVGVKQIVSPLTTLKGIREECIEGEVLTKEKPLTLLNVEKMMKHERMRVCEVVSPTR